MFNRRLLNFIAAISSFALIAIAILYFENHLLLDPCPFCMLERALFFIMGVLFLLASIHKVKRIGQRLYAGAILIAGSLGLYLTGRHVMMQYGEKASFGSCQQTSAAITDLFNIDWLTNILSAKGDCGEIEWALWGLSLPVWAFIAFLFLTLFGVINNWYYRALSL